MKRRTLLGTGAGAVAALAGCLGGGSGDDDYENWFSGVDNYDGETDMTGESEVTVSVGADDGLAFAPAAIIVDSGTTVTWEWTGNGGRHNVVERDDAFRSEYHDSEGATFEHTFEEAGTFPYYCEPHRAAGMKGGVRVE